MRNILLKDKIYGEVTYKNIKKENINIKNIRHSFIAKLSLKIDELNKDYKLKKNKNKKIILCNYLNIYSDLYNKIKKKSINYNLQIEKEDYNNLLNSLAIKKYIRTYIKEKYVRIEIIKIKLDKGINKIYNDDRTTVEVKEVLKEYMNIKYGYVFIKLKRRNIFVTVTNIEKRVLCVKSGGLVAKDDLRSKNFKRYKYSLVAREEIGNTIGSFCWENKIRFINMRWTTLLVNRSLIINVIRGLLDSNILIGYIYYIRNKGHGEIRAPAVRRI